MSAGELREKIIFEAREPLDDGYGNAQSGAWLEKFRVAARIIPRLGGEEIIAARLQSRKPVTLKVRVSRDTRQISMDWRGRNARTGEIYNLRSVVNVDEQGKYFEILAEAGVAA